MDLPTPTAPSPLAPAPAPAPQGPGKSLAQARTDLGLSREDVARQLHLKVLLIIALENDDYELLPGATYVRGYLRSYAQLLGLSAEPILEAHAQLVGGPQPASLPSLSPPPQATSGHRHIKLTTYLLATVVVGLALLWWQQGKNGSTPKTANTANMDVSVATQTDGPMGPPIDSKAAPTMPLTNADRAYMHTPTPLSGTTAAAAPARAQLSLYVEQESWIEVRDGLQNRLLYESLPSGRTLMLEGIAPLYVFLGNANGVRVEFNGKPFDLAPHMHGQVARFALGAGAAAGASR